MSLYTEVRKWKLLIAGTLLAVLGILPWAAAPANATFPGRNGKIAFESYSEGTFGIYTMNPDGTGRTRLTSSDDREAAWSPDGRVIAFTSNRDGNLEIYAMNADGSGVRRLTNNTGGDQTPAWSPDGTKIAFARLRDQSIPCGLACRGLNYEIYTMNADGTGQTRLTNNATPDLDPAWSPDGTRIAFSRHVADFFDEVCECRVPIFQIFTVSPDGSDTTMLTSMTNLSDYGVSRSAPDWSPDGTKIAFEAFTTPAVSGESFSNQIYTMNADGSGQARLTNNNIPWNFSPSWSPDGTKIAFGTDPTFELADIYAINTDGSEPVDATNNAPTPDFSPAWQPLVASPFKNGSKECKALPGDYRNHGQCVKANH